MIERGKCSLLEFLIAARGSGNDGKRIIGYGAPAKGNTLLNYCGIGPELLPYTVDLSPHKQGLYLSGHAHSDRVAGVDCGNAARLCVDSCPGI